jgi:putative nucleotidyltransferase with HDIG domain
MIYKLATSAEKEVEKLLRVLLPGTIFANKTYAVGGFTRDEILGVESKDLDIVVEMKDGAEKLTKFLHDKLNPFITQPHQMGAGYPIWQITFKDDIIYNRDIFHTNGAIIEFADTMKETFPDKNSRQRKTEFGSLKEDIERRDFVVNMLLKDLSTGEFVDLVGTSISDIKQGILRGNPNVDLNKIFCDDPIRMVRCLRFSAKYNWQVPFSILKIIKKNAQRIEIVSAERIMGELEKLMKIGKLHKAIKMMKVVGLLKYILPEVQVMIGVEQPLKHHAEGDTFRHTLLVLQNAPKTIEGQLAALLHDVGKPQSQQILEDGIHFYGHEEISADIAEAILYRLKFDRKTIEHVITLVKNHMRVHDLYDASDKALRKFIRDIGDEMIDALLDLGEADALGSLPVENRVPELRKRIKEIREAPVKIERKPILNGNEIMELLNVKPGPILKEVTTYLFDLQDEYAAAGKFLEKEKAKMKVLEKFK